MKFLIRCDLYLVSTITTFTIFTSFVLPFSTKWYLSWMVIFRLFGLFLLIYLLNDKHLSELNSRSEMLLISHCQNIQRRDSTRKIYNTKNKTWSSNKDGMQSSQRKSNPQPSMIASNQQRCGLTTRPRIPRPSPQFQLS